MKRLNDDNPFLSWTDEELRQQAKEYNELINGQMPCYGRRDLIIYSGIQQEIERRELEFVQENIPM